MPWICLKDQYPEAGKYYLFINGDHLPFVGLWKKDYGATVDGELCRPTHWMPLPEPPAASNNQPEKQSWTRPSWQSRDTRKTAKGERGMNKEVCTCTRNGGIDEDIQPIIDALEHLVFLHGCEQEGLESGMPTPEQWEQAVAAAHRALKEARKEVAQ